MKQLLSPVLTIILAFSTFIAPASPYLLVGAVATVAVTQTACDGDKKLSSAAEAAKDIAGGVRDTIDAVGKAYDQKLITLAQKDKYATLLGDIARGGKKGVDTIEALHKSGVTTLSKLDAQALNRIFTDEVVSPFLELLTDLGKLSDESALAIRTALASIRTAIVLLSNKIGRQDVIDSINAIQMREVWHVV